MEPRIENEPQLTTIDLRDRFGMEAALYVNEQNEVVGYFDVYGEERFWLLSCCAQALGYKMAINASPLPALHPMS